MTNLVIVEYAPLEVTVRLETVPWGSEQRRALVATFKSPWEALSWAPRGGGNTTSTSYCCLQVDNSDLPLEVEPQTVIDRFVSAASIVSPVVTLTSADIGAFCTAHASEQDVTAFVLVTTGFANALRVGELAPPPVTRPLPDTINIACWLNRSLTLEARLEALSIIAQARTLSVLEARIDSSDGSGFATGTGTDCISLFTRMPTATLTPASKHEPTNDQSLPYAGMHTSVGRVLGKVVREAMDTATTRWTHKHAMLLSAKRAAREA